MSWGYIAAAVTATVLSSALAPKQQALPAPIAPPPLPQASVAPDALATLKAQGGTGQSGGASGIAQTQLTKTGGVDPSALALNKTTLTGGTKTMLG